jgi:hypothetical protein
MLLLPSKHRFVTDQSWPPLLKANLSLAQALRLLPNNLTFPLSELLLTPYLPVPESNGEEWDRLEPTSALDALVELVLHGEYNGIDAGKKVKDDLEVRCAAVGVFEVSQSVGITRVELLWFRRILFAKKRSDRLSCRQCFLRRDQVSTFFQSCVINPSHGAARRSV